MHKYAVFTSPDARNSSASVRRPTHPRLIMLCAYVGHTNGINNSVTKI